MADRNAGKALPPEEFFPPASNSNTGRGMVPSNLLPYQHTHHHPQQPQQLQQYQQHQQQKVILIEAPKQRTPFRRSYWEMTCVVGLVEIVVGLLSIALGVSNALTCGFYGIVGYGVWCGCLFVICGIVALQMRRKKTTFLVITQLTLSNVAAMFAGVQFCLGVISASADNTPSMLSNRSCLYSAIYGLPNQPVNDANGRVVVDALLATVAAVLAIAAILASAYTCKGLCCPPRLSGSARSKFVAGGAECVPGHVICSANENQISVGTRAILNGVITFQGQEGSSSISTQQYMLHQAPNYGQRMQKTVTPGTVAATATAAGTSNQRSRPLSDSQARF